MTGYEDALWATRDPRLLVHPRMPTLLAQLSDDDRARAKPVIDHYAATLAFTDPPRHTAVRALFQKKFSASAVESLRPGIQDLVDSYLDAAGPDELDIMADLAFLLPVDVIGEMLGVPPPDRAQFMPWTERILGIFSTGRADAETAGAGLESLAEMRAYLQTLIDERTRQPRTTSSAGSWSMHARGRPWPMMRSWPIA